MPVGFENIRKQLAQDDTLRSKSIFRKNMDTY